MPIDARPSDATQRRARRGGIGGAARLVLVQNGANQARSRLSEPIGIDESCSCARTLCPSINGSRIGWSRAIFSSFSCETLVRPVGVFGTGMLLFSSH